MLKQQEKVTYLEQGGEKQEHRDVGEEADQLCEDVPTRQGVPAKHVEKSCREEVPAKQADQLHVQVEQEEHGDKEQQHRDEPLAVGKWFQVRHAVKRFHPSKISNTMLQVRMMRLRSIAGKRCQQ